MNNLKKISTTLLRVGIALVFIWFGWSQINSPKDWVGYIPQWVSGILSLSAFSIVYLNGLFEIIFGTALLLGFYTRFVAFCLAFHMVDITLIVGMDSIGVRDFGLSVAAVVVWINGSDKLSLDYFIQSDNEIVS